MYNNLQTQILFLTLKTLVLNLFNQGNFQGLFNFAQCMVIMYMCILFSTIKK